MSLFPIFVKLEGRLIVVVGGGTIAEAKIPGMLGAGARIRLIAPSITPQIAGWVRFGKIDWLPKAFEAADLDGAFLVIAATSAPGVNEAVFREAETRGILCNAVDDIERCHFYYGAVVQRGDLQIAISTNGKASAGIRSAIWSGVRSVVAVARSGARSTACTRPEFGYYQEIAA